MQKSPPNPSQGNFLFPNLIDQLDPSYPLLKLSQHIPWQFFEVEFAPLYSHWGKPAKAIRLMVGLSILKHVENLSDDVLVNRWVQNPYYQMFCGETVFQRQLPCDSSDMTYFRKRIGEAGFEKILSSSIALFGEAAQEKSPCRQHGTGKECHVPHRCEAISKNHCAGIKSNFTVFMSRTFIV